MIVCVCEEDGELVLFIQMLRMHVFIDGIFLCVQGERLSMRVCQLAQGETERSAPCFSLFLFCFFVNVTPPYYEYRAGTSS